MAYFLKCRNEDGLYVVKDMGATKEYIADEDGLKELSTRSKVYGYSERKLTFYRNVNDLCQRHNAILKLAGLPFKVTAVPEGLFLRFIGDINSGDDRIRTLRVPDFITGFWAGSLSSLRSLEKLILHDGVVSFGDMAMEFGSSLLKTIKFPNGLVRIGDHCFSLCKGLESLVLPKSVEDIGRAAFSNCSSLRSVIADCDNWSYLPEMLFQYSGLREFKVPKNVKAIMNRCFSGCKDLQSIVLNEELTDIGRHSFEGCSSLTSVSIPKNTKGIGDCAFSGCTSLKRVEIYGSDIEIGKEAFQNCSNLQSIKFSNITREEANRSLLEIESYFKAGTVRFKGE